MTDSTLSVESHSSMVTQEGIVEEMRNNHALVRIYQNSSCAGCKVSGSCSSKTLGGNNSRIIEAMADDGVAVGSKVILRMRTRDGFLSVLLSFILPLILLFSFILSLQSLDIREEMLALGGLGVLSGYYLILSLFRNILKRHISFTAVPASQAHPVVCDNL
ncbi:SoxR reducing system RseC family protein [Salinispira pacifica]|uniref:Sigma factor RpoE regulatory protein RseC n=1 Tax=Salinispira pacifica TaxID=1307761 RepID=V5WDI5_9SPIO|nr:SoxR reducing system RseC family protein [Salinispira pacifica]AHC13878.1 hypothetical protein L21SP2_0446 [Salinispira pacifica]